MKLRRNSPLRRLQYFPLTFMQARIEELESSQLTEKEEFESQLADKEAAEEELQKQKEEAENEVVHHFYTFCDVV